MKRKRVGREKSSGENKREIERETESCYERLMAWVINLTVGYEG
jgi:hypothetical protein